MLFCNTCGCLFEPIENGKQHDCLKCSNDKWIEQVKKHTEEMNKLLKVGKDLSDIAVGPIPTMEIFWKTYYKMVGEGYEKSEETVQEEFFEGGYLCASCPQLDEYEIVYCLEEEIHKAKIVDPYEYLGILELPDIAVGPVNTQEEFDSVLKELMSKGYKNEGGAERFFEGEYILSSCKHYNEPDIRTYDECELPSEKHIKYLSVQEFLGIEKLAEEKEPSNIDSSLRGYVQDTSTEEECQAPASKQVTIGTGSDAPASIHYRGDVEPIDLIDAQGFGIGFCAGNAIKYYARFDKKGTPIQDVEKALWYGKHLLKLLKEGHNS